MKYTQSAQSNFYFTILIYSLLTFRYGNEDKLVTLMGVMQALISFVQDGKNSLRYVVRGKLFI